MLVVNTEKSTAVATPARSGWGDAPATLAQTILMFLYQFVMSIALVMLIFWAWPQTRPTDNNGARGAADGAVGVKVDSSSGAAGRVPPSPANAASNVPVVSTTPADSDTTVVRDTQRAPTVRTPVTASNAHDSAGNAAERDSVDRREADSKAIRAFFIVVICAGALGNLFRGIGSLAWYTGTRTLLQSWLFTYYAQPVKGALLGLLFFFVFRAGLVASSTSIVESNPAGFAALAALVGMFDREATRKLKRVAEAIFESAQEKVDHTPPNAPATNNPVPVISEVKCEPDRPIAGTREVKVTLSGTGFTTATSAEITSGSPPQSHSADVEFQSSSAVAVRVGAEDLDEPGQVLVSLVNPPPGGGRSASRAFQVESV
jgi:hypothetical protein